MAVNETGGGDDSTSSVLTPPKPPQSTNTKRRWPRIFLILGLIALIVYGITHLFHRKSPSYVVRPQTVSVSKAIRGDMPETIEALGTVTPTTTVTVLPQLSGYLTEVGYIEGQEVAKGQFLAQIDSRQYEISKQQAQAQLARDRATLAQTRADLARYQRLHDLKSIAEQTFTDQQFAVLQEEAAVQSDLANIRQFELDLSYCRIISPVSGRVGLRLVDPGNYVTASSNPGIAVITTIQPTTVVFSVPQDSLGKILQRYRTGAQLPVAAYSSDNTRQLATGVLYAINNQMATSTGTVNLRAEFIKEDKVLYPNEFVNVSLLVDTLRGVLIVPAAAVQKGAPGDFVYRVNADDTVSVNKVTVGPNDGMRTVITSGLEVDTSVVIDGVDRLSDGAKVRISTISPASAALSVSEAAPWSASSTP